MEIIKTNFHKKTNVTGCLTFLEAERDVPFAIKRVYYVYGVEPHERRGFHAHRALRQYLVCVHGSCRVLLDDGREKAVAALDDASVGLYVGPGVWHEMYDFTDGTVLLVLASDYYDENDYIRDYDEFLEFAKGAER